MKIKQYIGILILFTGVILVAIIFYSSRSFADPIIIWTPSSLSETISLSASKTTSVSFTTSKNLNNVVVRIVPALEPFLRIDQSTFESIAKGETLTLDLIISPLADSPLGTFEGTIQLRSESKPSKAFAKPLPITVNVWKIAQQSGYVFLYPPDYEISDASDDRNIGLVSSSTQSATNSNAIETFDDISIVVVENTEDITVFDFATQYDGGWFENYQSKEEVIIGGRNAVRYSDIGSLPGRAPMVAIFIEEDSRIFIFSINHYVSPESIELVRVFDQIISSFEIQ